LLVCQVPWILKPDIPGILDQFFVLSAFFPDFVSADLVNGLIEMSDNMKLVEDHRGIGCVLSYDLDIRVPHIATDAFEILDPLRAKRGKEAGEGGLCPFFTAPYELAGLQIIDIGQIHLTFFPGNFVDPNMGKIREIPMCQTILDHVINSRSHSPPRAIKELGHMFPGQEPGPGSQEMGKSRSEPALASAPGKVLNLDATLLTSHPAWTIAKPYRDAPKGNMPVMTNRESVTIAGSASTRAAKEQVTSIRDDVHNDFIRIALDLADTKSLNIQRRFDQLGHEHEFLRGSWCVW
jgi:hypothetical protein